MGLLARVNVGVEMRVLVGSNRYFNDVAGGGNRVAWDAAQQLAVEGHDVVLLCEGIEGTPETDLRGAVRILRYKVPAFDVDFFSRHQRAAKRTLLRQLSDWHADVIWGHMPLQMSAMMDVFPTAAMTYTMHSPVSIETMESESAFSFGLTLKSKVLLSIERKCCEAARTITVLSEFTKSEIKLLHGVRIATKVQITPGWADIHRFHLPVSRDAVKDELEWPKDRPVFFCVRRFVSRMGLAQLLDAAAI